MIKNNQMVYGLGGLIMGIALTTFLIPNNSGTYQNSFANMMGNNSINQRTQMGSNIDKHFIEEMIPHHEGAIDMANLALTRDTKPKIKALATNIIKSQTNEIVQMKAWYKSWFGTEVPEDTDREIGMGRGMMHGGMMGDEADISSLEKAENFDKAFIDDMIPHHQMALMMSNMLLSSTSRPEMKQLGENIISAQTEEIAEMRGWYADWGY